MSSTTTTSSEELAIPPSGRATNLRTTKWDVVAGIAIIHIGALFGFVTFSWSAFWVFLGLQITTAMGITLCYHRLLTHRSFQVPKWLEYVLTVCGCLALQGGPLKWVATHRVHHAFSDRPQDPHSPTRGFWWAHMLWLFAYDEVLDDRPKFERYVPELARDRFYQILDRAHVLPTVILGVLLFAWGGFPYLVWGLFVRTMFVYHGTWLVNSAAHLWGYQTFQTNEGSTNNWWVALLSFGEGWHNNHHAYLHSAAHGLRWWEFDMTYAAIRFLAAVGLASRVRLPQGNPARLPQVEPISKRFLNKVNVPVPSLSV